MSSGGDQKPDQAAYEAGKRNGFAYESFSAVTLLSVDLLARLFDRTKDIDSVLSEHLLRDEAAVDIDNGDSNVSYVRMLNPKAYRIKKQYTQRPVNIIPRHVHERTEDGVVEKKCSAADMLLRRIESASHLCTCKIPPHACSLHQKRPNPSAVRFGRATRRHPYAVQSSTKDASKKITGDDNTLAPHRTTLTDGS